jgi:hypothetical protein
MNDGYSTAARYQAAILAQIREGKRTWSYADKGKDFEAFRREVVEPLRQLKYAGVVSTLSEIQAAAAGNERITGVQIIGAVKKGFAEGDK